MSITCDELIKRLRAAKSPQQEYNILEDELALIRTSLKSKEQQNQSNNIAKLIYASMRGHSVAWGEIGIVNLCQSAKNYKEKRLAYLALSLVPHENDMFITMTSNTIKQDLESGSKTRQQVGIVALSQVGTPEMLSQLSVSIQALLKEDCPNNIRKKAYIAALKTIQLCPDIAETFIQPCMEGVNSKIHSVCMTACELAIELLRCVPQSVQQFSQKYNHFIGVLARLSNINYKSQDHAIGGVSDPFLQSAMIRFISELTQKADKQFIDIKKLADVFENIVSTPFIKSERITARVALVFECSKAIMRLPESIFDENKDELSNLRAAAADALTQSLDHKNQSVRYSALASIVEIIHKTGESQGVQRNRGRILDCMEEQSITLRRRALNLLVLISDSESAESSISKLLNLIGKQEDGRYYILQDALNEDIREEIINSVAFIAEMFSTDPKWEFEVYVKCLQLCGPSKVNKQLVSQTTSLVAREKKLESIVYTTFNTILTSTLAEQNLLYNESLISASLYIIGELAHLITDPDSITSSLYNIIEGSIQSQILIKYSVSTLAKMIIKAKTTNEIGMNLLQSLMKSYDPEIQQRACEYFMAIKNPKAAGILGKIPPPPKLVSKVMMTEGSKRVQQVVPQQVVAQVVPQQIVAQIGNQPQMQQFVPQPVQQQIVPQLPQVTGFQQVVPQVMPMQINPMMNQRQFASVQPVQKQPFLPQPIQLQQPVASVQIAAKAPDSFDDIFGIAPEAQIVPVNSQVQILSNNLLDDILPMEKNSNGTEQSNKLVYTSQFMKIFTRSKLASMGVEIDFLYTSNGIPIQLKVSYAPQSGTDIKTEPISGSELSGSKNITQKIYLRGQKLGIRIKLTMFVNGVQKEELVTIENLM